MYPWQQADILQSWNWTTYCYVDLGLCFLLLGLSLDFFLSNTINFSFILNVLLPLLTNFPNLLWYLKRHNMIFIIQNILMPYLRRTYPLRLYTKFEITINLFFSLLIFWGTKRYTDGLSSKDKNYTQMYGFDSKQVD